MEDVETNMKVRLNRYENQLWKNITKNENKINKTNDEMKLLTNEKGYDNLFIELIRRMIRWKDSTNYSKSS